MTELGGKGSLGILAVVVSVVMVGIGMFWAIPNLGLIGLIWTAVAIFIAISSIRRLLAKR